ncbi:MAG: flagellar biosynthetic protein FliR [Treponema sp.]|nr:flagellar biosynthetic protein FliR [Treponema sp.]
MLDYIVNKAPVYLLVFARCFALLMTTPLFSMRSVPRTAKVALAGYMSFFLLGIVDFSSYMPFIAEDGSFSLIYILLILGEALIGVVIGFYITMIFSAFSTAGQFMAFQMGFSAASTYDAMAQVENPLMGQFFNFIAMFIFLQNGWIQKLFLSGLNNSFRSINVLSLITAQEGLVNFFFKGLTKLFADAMIISLPVMGTLLLITVCTGLLSKAAPQMNLLSEGFPIMILVSFFIIYLLIEPMCEFFINSFAGGFNQLQNLFLELGGHIK